MVSSEDFKSSPSARLPNLTGRLVDNGRLHLLKIIGRGGWGIVYLAKAVGDGPERLFAVKCVMCEDIPDDEAENLKRELVLHKRCQDVSKLVLKLVHVFEDRDMGLLFAVTQHCPDGDLLEMILADTFFGKDDLIRSAYIQLLDAVQACHSTGIYHRDLKPENVLCTNGGKRIVLADFGFATTERVSTDFRIGSEPFMSPEVLGGLNRDLSFYSCMHADVWSLGIVLMNLVCKSYPWEKASMRNRFFVEYCLHDRDYLLHKFPISMGLNDILKSIFTTDPDKRTSIAELRQRIEALDTFYNADPAEDMHGDHPEVLEEDEILSASESDSFSSSNTYLSSVYSFPEVPTDPCEALETYFKLVNQGVTNRLLRTTSEGLVGRPVPTATRRQSSTPLELFETAPSFFAPRSAHSNDYDKPDIADSEDGEDSDSESEGPITPEQCAADASGAVDDLEDINGLADLHLDDGPEDGQGISAQSLVDRCNIFFPKKVTETLIPPAGSDNDDEQMGRPSAKSIFLKAARVMGVPI